MQNRLLTVIPADEAQPVRCYIDDDELKTLQRIVGGFIEIVPHWGWHGEHRCDVFANEDGRGRLPVNDRATKMWLEHLGAGPFRYKPELFGDVVIVQQIKRVQAGERQQVPEERPGVPAGSAAAPSLTPDAASFSDVRAALTHWRASSERSSLRNEVRPPIDALDDEIHDVMLAVWFARLCELHTIIERVGFLHLRAKEQRAIIAQLETARPEYQVEAQANIARIRALLTVLEKWMDELSHPLDAREVA